MIREEVTFEQQEREPAMESLGEECSGLGRLPVQGLWGITVCGGLQIARRPVWLSLNEQGESGRRRGPHAARPDYAGPCRLRERLALALGETGAV